MLLPGKAKQIIGQGFNALNSLEYNRKTLFLRVGFFELLVDPLDITLNASQGIPDLVCKHGCHLADESKLIPSFQVILQVQLAGKHPFEHDPARPEKN